MSLAMVEDDTERDDPPPGFRRAAGLCGPFIERAGPLYGRLAEQELVLGFRVLRRHTNPLDCAHGGMLASLADMLLAAGTMYREEGWGRVLPTVSLQLDYLAPARRGAWVEGRMQVLKATGSLVFAQGLVSADGEPALRASGVLRRGESGEGRAMGQEIGQEWDPLQLKQAHNRCNAG